ncbi:MAG TPA: TonB-dependent siderophore receptor [Stenotrophomonas sp.]|nr:TonB-dependent siderophore receptor [Stenotrophomonas sp.]
MPMPAPSFLRHALFAGITLALASPLLLAAPSAHAADTAGTVHRFDLPAQPLGQALLAFGEQSGLQVSVDSTLLGSRSSAAVRGSYSDDQALAQLLAGSGLSWRRQGQGVVVEAQPTARAGEVRLDTLRVEGAVGRNALPAAYAGGQVASGSQLGLLGNVSVMDTPFNTVSYTREMIENQQAQSLADVLDNDPSVRVSAPRNGENGSVMIRGFEFTAREALINGMYGMADTRDTMIESVERIEVHKGPSAMLNGISPWGSSPGGSVNYVLKRAGDDPLTRLTTTYASSSQFGGHLDVGRRFGAQGQFGVRLNSVYRDGDTELDHTRNRTQLHALALDYRGERLRANLDLNYQDRLLWGGISSTRIGSSISVPSAPDNTTNSKQPWEMYDGQNRYVMARVEYDLAPNWTIGAAWGDNRSDEVYLLTIDSITNNNGDKSGTPYWIPARSHNESWEASLKGEFVTGPVAHSLSVVASRNDAGRGQLTWSVPGYPYNSLPSNIYSPIYYPAPDTSSLTTAGLRDTSRYQYQGVAVADMMHLLDDRLLLMVGARDQTLEFENLDYASGRRTSGYRRSRVTPSAGVVYKLRPDTSVYVSYIERLAPGGTVSTYYANGGEVFEPTLSDQYEIGAKHDNGRFTTTVSVFQTKLPSTVEVDNPAGGSPFLRVDGLERHRGLELNVFGQLTDSVRLLGGAMLLDARMVSTEGGTNDGRRARGAPRFNFNLGSEWDVAAVPGLTFSGRLLHTSRENIDLTERRERSIPAWTRVDVGARYAFEAAGKPMKVNLSIDNLFDRDYWAAASRGVLSMGGARALRLSYTVDL